MWLALAEKIREADGYIFSSLRNTDELADVRHKVVRLEDRLSYKSSVKHTDDLLVYDDEKSLADPLHEMYFIEG